MASGLFGIYNAQRSILINQAAMNVINSNIANVNTPGYSKQRIDISHETILNNQSNNSVTGFPVIESITRNRDLYLDNYYRGENSDYAYYEELNNNITAIETVINELSDTGISEDMAKFYNSAQQLSLNPTDIVARNDFVQKATDVSNKFNIIYNNLMEIKENLAGDGTNIESINMSKVGVICTDINNKIARIAELNGDISTSTAIGAIPNALLDQRDILIDELSKIIPITVVPGSTNLVTISVNNTEILNDTMQTGYFKAERTSPADPSKPVTVKIKDGDSSSANTLVSDAASVITSGQLGAVLEVAGSEASGKLTIDSIINKLNTAAAEFAKRVNEVHKDGQYIDKTTGKLASVTDLNPAAGSTADYFDIFVESGATGNKAAVGLSGDYTSLNAGNITISDIVKNDPFRIAAAKVSITTDPVTGLNSISDTDAVGDGSNVLSIANLRNTKYSNLDSQTLEKYVVSISSNFGVQADTVKGKFDVQDAILQQAKSRRESVIGVNLDEELLDLIKFQRSFEASARAFSVCDQVLQKIIQMV